MLMSIAITIDKLDNNINQVSLIVDLDLNNRLKKL
jgi:hypothetical protein